MAVAAVRLQWQLPAAGAASGAPGPAAAGPLAGPPGVFHLETPFAVMLDGESLDELYWESANGTLAAPLGWRPFSNKSTTYPALSRSRFRW